MKSLKLNQGIGQHLRKCFKASKKFSSKFGELVSDTRKEKDSWCIYYAGRSMDVLALEIVHKGLSCVHSKNTGHIALSVSHAEPEQNMGVKLRAASLALFCIYLRILEYCFRSS